MNTLIHLLEAAVIAGTPLLLGALGEILCERAGNLNLGVERGNWASFPCGFCRHGGRCRDCSRLLL